MSTPYLGKCSKHRHIREFSVGDKIRVVCEGGRTYAPPLGSTGSIVEILPPGQGVYAYALEIRWGGLARVYVGSRGNHYYLSPRAMEKISQ